MPPGEPALTWLVRFAVLASPIAGRGVFASESLDADTLVARLESAVVSVDSLGSINHSCDPSLWWTGDALCARHSLDAGDELTVDYSTCCTDFVLYCRCDTYRCRQVAEGSDWQIPQLQQRYSGHWAPPVQYLIAAAHNVRDLDTHTSS